MLDIFEGLARAEDLLGSFSVMLASSILIVPWERMNNRHPRRHEIAGDLQRDLRVLERQRWRHAAFWRGAPPGDWRFSRIMGDPNRVDEWQDENRRPSFSVAANTIDGRTVGEVFRVLRNGLAHGNIIYLDADGHETAGNRVEHIAFLSRYEETLEERDASETYRLLTVSEVQFLPFVRAWARWVSRRHSDDDLRAA